jgi:hypothetical protein
MTDQPGAAKVFDMPHARVTLTPIGPNVEIEVWPKAGQSAYAVISPNVAILIARHLVEMAAAQLSAAQVMAAVTTGLAEDEAAEVAEAAVMLAAQDGGAPVAEPVPAVAPNGDLASDDGPHEDQPAPEPAVPSNVVDLASRRPRRGGTPA